MLKYNFLQEWSENGELETIYVLCLLTCLSQEVDGMTSTLDETLCNTNPHFSKVLKEKMAVREAAHKAIEARKAALVEASWLRILRAAR